MRMLARGAGRRVTHAAPTFICRRISAHRAWAFRPIMTFVRLIKYIWVMSKKIQTAMSIMVVVINKKVVLFILSFENVCVKKLKYLPPGLSAD